ncbi:MAG: sortase, partial [Patescibacteria group bacterium]
RQKNESDISKYLISIPRLNIENAVVSTIDTNTTKYLVNYGKDNIPGKFGNALIFGHSTLPQFFNAKNYKTIFANIYKLRNGDKIYATVGDSIYLYRVIRSIVVPPSDMSPFEQDYNNSYITLVTCTPPGTLWKRLIVKARFEKTI